MSYCYADDNTFDQVSSQHHYLHLMPESPLQHKLPSNNSPTPSHVSSDMAPNSQLDHEKRVRREIANCNERRRMQSINTGFQSLKILIPHSCGEKLSKACILQRAADHIKSLENEKIKLQSQNEQFRILIKSFQIDSSSVLQAQRRLSTNDSDETVLLLANNDESKPVVNNVYDDVKNHHTYWHAEYVQSPKDEQPSPHIDKYYRTVKQSTPATTSDTTYMIVQQSQPSQRCYKTNSLDQNSDNGIVIVERCQFRTQSVDTNNTVSRRNLQTIVEAIRHLEGDDALANMNQTQQSSSSTHQQEDLPAQIKAMINEKFQQQTNNKNPSSPSSTNTIYQQTINTYEQQKPKITMTHDSDLHQKPPKKRKITYNESDDTIIQRSDLPPITSPEVHHHEQISNESSPPSTVTHLLQEHLIQHTLRYSPH
ncbi:unnamed protein product [Adineta steineri]|uniref:BHLH domain-containing protein n=1 Tax=Adineta steineri TaxID=433720 RepID=A0A815BFB6_9BILA|nr:unnamed protein product [Adineta steineri]CAF1269859.1 unnamed protein product [Adineta steineri]CAF1286133.1 unnamed protein product [Adineta steineri]CAF1308920.1 unnamed protein product [Adineta steineri]CAF1534845.1 unnamed protein product [Adineta steineri]